MKITVYSGDITALNVDAVVNAANRSLLGGGGVDGAIHRAAGPELLAECKTLGGCETGRAKTTQAYNMLSKYVIHTVGPVWHGGGRGEEELLRSCYISSLSEADRRWCKTVAFPAISTGVYGYPKEQAAQIAISSIKDYFRENPQSCIEEVVLVCFNEATEKIYNKWK